MRLSIAHTTTYTYDVAFAGETYMEARLRPLSISGRQVCEQFHLSTIPPAPIFEYGLAGEDGTVSHFTLKDEGHSTLVIRAESVVDTLVENPFEGITLDENDWDRLDDPDLKGEMAEWLAPTALTPSGEWSTLIGPCQSVLEFGQSAMEYIYRNFEYMPGATDVSTPLETFVNQRRGVCQDYAHLMISIARKAGVPARYVSGYVFSGSDANTHGSDATHAWVELYIPHAGMWKGFDPTNNVLASNRHVKIATGRDYADVPPTKGILRPLRDQLLPGRTELTVDVRVTEV